MNFDPVKIKEGGLIQGYVVVETNDRSAPTSMVSVRARYIDPVRLEPDMIVVGPEERGEVERVVHMKTSGLSRVRRVAFTKDRGVRVLSEDSEARRDHVLRVVVPEVEAEVLDVEVVLDVDVAAADGRQRPRTTKFPVHRFPDRGMKK